VVEADRQQPKEATMAARDEQAPANWFSPLDALRRVQELGAQLSGTARSFLEPQAQDEEDEELDEDGDAAEGQARRGLVPQPFAAWAERSAELSTMWVAPMRAVLQEQQDLIDAISSWAEEQRKLADRFSELAERHRQLNEGVMSTLTPTLDHLDRLAGRMPGKQAANASKAAKTSKSTGRKRSAR
jgi:hypothetical protein